MRNYKPSSNTGLVKICLIGAQFLSMQAFAQDSGYRPPDTPSLYEKSDLDHSEKGTGLYFNGGIGLGQSNLANDNTDTGLLTRANGEIGFSKVMKTGNRVDVGFQLLAGAASFSDDANGDHDLTLVGGVAKLGYGFSMGSGTFGSLKLGLGAVSVDHEYSGDLFDAESSEIGLMTMVGFDLDIPMNDWLIATGGIEYSHIGYDFKPEGDDSVKFNMNTFGANIGVKLQL